MFIQSPKLVIALLICLLALGSLTGLLIFVHDATFHVEHPEVADMVRPYILLACTTIAFTLYTLTLPCVYRKS